MSRQEYLSDLKILLKKLPSEEVDEILNDYEEHFEQGQVSGKSDAEIIKQLGPVKIVAKDYIVGSLIEESASTNSVAIKGTNLVRIILTTLALAPFNFLMAFGPFVLMLGIISSFWIGSLSLLYASIEILLAFVQGSIGIERGSDLAVTYLSGSFGLLGAGALGIIFAGLLTYGAYQIILKYLKWNQSLIVGTQV